MTSKTLRQRLEAQYTKLNIRIQKSIKTGRFYQYTQFKRDQLFGRLERYSMQMKRLSMGLGIVAALGVANPVVGQIPNFSVDWGNTNPIDSCTFYNSNISQPIKFIDIDNDGDLDMFASQEVAYPAFTNLEYFENIGNRNNPVFSNQPSINPLPVTMDICVPEFVDIDNDGDLDCFTTGVNYYTTPICLYFENQGTATVPNFVQQTGANNPLEDLNVKFPTNPGFYSRPYLTAIDVDNDNDFDFVFQKDWNGTSGMQEIIFYRNTGTANSPTLLVDTPEPTDFIDVDGTDGILGRPIQWVDIDKDGDLDLLSTTTINGGGIVYYENAGSATSPLFSVLPTTSTILDSVPDLANLQRFTIVDIDDDGDFDMFGVNTFTSVDSFGYTVNTVAYAYYENLDTTIVSVSKIMEEEHIGIFPNPSMGLINFDKPISGNISIYNTAGQLLFEKIVEDKKMMTIPNVNNGLYFLVIETGEAIIREKIMIQK